MNGRRDTEDRSPDTRRWGADEAVPGSASRGYQGGSGYEGTGMYGMPGTMSSRADSRDTREPAGIGTRSFVEEGLYYAGMDGRGHHPERAEPWGASGGPYGQFRAMGRDDPSAGHADRAGERQWRPESRPQPAWRQPGPASARPRGPKGWQRSDERVRDDICERLHFNEHIDSSEVSVEVRDGLVVLEGTVGERAMKHAIEDLVDSIPGVREIDNRIRVSRAQQPAGARAADPTPSRRGR